MFTISRRKENLEHPEKFSLCPFSSPFNLRVPGPQDGEWRPAVCWVAGSFLQTGPGAVSAAAPWNTSLCPWSADGLAVGTVECSTLLLVSGKVLDPGGWMESTVGKLTPVSGSVLLTLGITLHALQRRKPISRVQVTYCLFLCVCPNPVGCSEIWYFKI